MHQRQNRVELDREPTIRRGHEQTLTRDAPELAQELRLLATATDMFQHGARMHMIEGAILKGKSATIGTDEPKARIHLLKKCRVIDAHGGDAGLCGYQASR